MTKPFRKKCTSNSEDATSFINNKVKRMKKKKFFILPILYCCIAVQAQTSSKNYLLEKQMLDAAGNQAFTTVTYYDGLRYPVETASNGLVGNGKFLVSAIYHNQEALVVETRLTMPDDALLCPIMPLNILRDIYCSLLLRKTKKW